jgi:uncharacterized membrane protein YqgA involved in biofilm formation
VRGLGTVLNIVAILVGSTIGSLLGSRLPKRTADTITDGIGLIVLVVAAFNIVAIRDAALQAAVGTGALLIVLGAVILGGLIGSLASLETRFEGVGDWLRRRLVRKKGAQPRFVEGFVTASLLFVIGPLGILGSISDGLGHGIDQLALKAVLDGVTAIAFASAFGWGVAASAIAVGVYQAAWTSAGALMGDLLPAAQLAALTATGGVLLLGTGLRLLRIRTIQVADLLPALAIAPPLTWAVTTLLHH